MTKRIRFATGVGIVGVLLLTGAAAVFAHHSFAAEFDASKPMKLTGHFLLYRRHRYGHPQGDELGD
jgi:hypothetical protein